MVKLGFMEKAWEIKLQDNLHINFTIKSPLKVSLSLLPPYYPHNFYILWRRNIFPFNRRRRVECKNKKETQSSQK